jgi:hypothetical protein
MLLGSTVQPVNCLEVVELTWAKPRRFKDNFLGIKRQLLGATIPSLSAIRHCSIRQGDFELLDCTTGTLRPCQRSPWSAHNINASTM